MLEGMAVPGPCEIEALVDLEKRIAVGKCSYGPDGGPPASPDRPVDTRVFLVGEILNDDVSRSPSQPEYLRERYRGGSGADFAAGLNGSFAAAIVDRADAAVVLVTDHLNSCPIFVAVHEGRFYFATEVKGLTAVRRLPCEPNPAAVLSMLTSNQLLGLETFVAGVEQLDYATVCRVGGGRVSREQVWRYSIDDEARDEGAGVQVERMRGALRRAAARCLGRGRTAILLSGGEDSRLIASSLPDASQVTAITYTARAEGQRHALGDAALAAALAERVGLEHHVVRYDPGEVLGAIRQSVRDADGAAGFIHQNIWDRLHEQFALDYVILGDECFGLSAGRVRESQVLDCLMIRPLGSLPGLWPFLNPGRIEEFLELSEASCRRVQSARLGRPPHNQVDELWHGQGIARMFNPKRRSLARHRILVRRPLLDRDVLDLLRSVPYRYRRGKWLARKSLAAADRSLSRLPRARVGENVAYDPYLAAIERDGRGVSSFILDDNPLFERFFDAERVGGLIGEVTERGRRPAKAAAFSWRRCLPPRCQRWLVAKARRYLGLKARRLSSPCDLLLRIALVAEVLRHVAGRCRAAGGRAH